MTVRRTGHDWRNYQTCQCGEPGCQSSWPNRIHRTRKAPSMTPTRRIYRTEIPITDTATQLLSGYRYALHVAPSRTRPETHLEIWYEAEAVDEAREVRFHVHGTGHPFNHHPLNTPYIGTVLTNGGQLVWHVYAEYPGSEALS